jgi:hypothetical protein
MSAEEAYDLYWHLPGTSDPAQLSIITALGDHAWKMRQEEDAGKPKPQYLPMPEQFLEKPQDLRPKFKRSKVPSKPQTEAVSGAQFFLSGLRS